MEHRKLEAFNGLAITPEVLSNVIQIIYNSLHEIYNECMFLRGRLEEFENRLSIINEREIENANNKQRSETTRSRYFDW